MPFFRLASQVLSSYVYLSHCIPLTFFLTLPQSTPRPHMQPSLQTLHGDLHALVGDRIGSEGTPPTLGPVIIGVTGYVCIPCRRLILTYGICRAGNVSKGALDLLRHLPHQWVKVEDLPALVTDAGQALYSTPHLLPELSPVRQHLQKQTCTRSTSYRPYHKTTSYDATDEAHTTGQTTMTTPTRTRASSIRRCALPCISRSHC